MEAAPAMASSSSETGETGPLVEAVPAPDANEDHRAAVAAVQRNMLELRETMTSLGLIPDQPMDFEDIEIGFPPGPGVLEKLAIDRQLMQDCLDHYNRLHPGNEYEPVLGNASRNPHFHNGICWTHGNFIARKKRFGPLSFLLAPRDVFFYELAYIHDFDEVITCTPVEEPAYYTALGILLWLATLRSAKLDTFCKTCYCQFGIPRHGTKKIFDCGHNNVGNVCEMCSHRSYTWHPDPGEFAFGYHHPYQP